MVTLGGYKYNSDQLKYIEQTEPQPNDIPDHLEEKVPEYGYLSQPSIAFDPTVNDGYCSNTLVCRNVPKWVNQNQLHMMFRSYFENGTDIVLPKIYPRINMLDKKTHWMVFVSFDQGSDDALQIIHMVRRINVFIPNTGTDENTTYSSSKYPQRYKSLVFGFAYDNSNKGEY